MPHTMTAPSALQDLIQRFKDNAESYRSNQYNETQLRREFLDPFFKTLGWDVNNERGYAEAYKDVIHEDAIKIGGATKAPDYCFRIGGTRKFFVEAKKPAVNVKDDVSPAFQLRRYAWSAKLPLSILTDFEEFAVYDCRLRPLATDKSSQGRVMYLEYADYVTRWEEIAATFSREAVLKGSFDKFAESTRAKRGTAEVDDAFLDEIESWRDLLARNIALRNPNLSQRELNFAVQRTIDRIIFLRICEDRGIEPYGTLQGLRNGDAVYKRMFERFYRADERYNSGLFHFAPERERPEIPDDLTPSLEIDDKPLKDILGRLYYPESPYEFSVLPADILGQVYEQFLGKVIRLTAGHQAKVEEKPEVRKAGGVYYTPTYIVDYIVKNTVGKLLEGKTPQEIGGLTEAWRPSKTRRPLTVLDPACGSGSFLLGAYQYLLDWYRDQYVADGAEKHAAGATPRLYQRSGGDWRLTTAERKRILLAHIHGVDIDAQAVETTKLSLLLKVLEGETQEGIDSQLRLFHERALPDLGSNIKCGNSLIGSNFYENQQLLLVDEETRTRINVFDWDGPHGFPEIMKAGGFDAVIGNPPYIRIQRIGHAESDYLFRTYDSPTSKVDLSLLFIERAISLVGSAGCVGMICTSQWMSTDYGKNLRGMLSDGRLHEITDFGSLPVFQEADTYPAVFVLGKKRAPSIKVRRIARAEQLNLTSIESVSWAEIPITELSDNAWTLGGLSIRTVLHNHHIEYAPLGEFGNAYIGALTGMDAAFVLDAKDTKGEGIEREVMFPYAYRGAEVFRYSEVRPNARAIYPYREGAGGAPEIVPEGELKRLYPKAHAHLVSHKEALRNRMDSRRLYATGADWYRYLRPGSFSYIRPTKLLVKGIDTRSCVGLLGANTLFNGANCPGVIIQDGRGQTHHYFLGILNSSLASYHLKSVCPAKLGGYTRFNASNISDLPIRVIDFSNKSDVARHDKMVSLVEQMLALHKSLAGAKMPHDRESLQRQIDATDEQIDHLVYDLYGLTDDEIKIVEEGTQT